MIFPKVTEKVNGEARKRSPGPFDPQGSATEPEREQRQKPKIGKPNDKEPWGGKGASHQLRAKILTQLGILAVKLDNWRQLTFFYRDLSHKIVKVAGS